MGRPSFCRRTTHMSLVAASRQTHPKGRVLANQRELASHVVPLPLVLLDDLHAGVGAICTTMRFAIGTPGWWNQEARTWSSTILSPHVIYYEKRPVAVATPMRFSSATTFLWRALQAPQMQDARMSPEQARQTRCTASKPPCSASCQRLVVQIVGRRFPPTHSAKTWGADSID